tara:strand:+ start:238 stop:534 length:297 start_codon:yes stop_codon:yes gene_type:complete
MATAKDEVQGRKSYRDFKKDIKEGAKQIKSKAINATGFAKEALEDYSKFIAKSMGEPYEKKLTNIIAKKRTATEGSMRTGGSVTVKTKLGKNKPTKIC